MSPCPAIDLTFSILSLLFIRAWVRWTRLDERRLDYRFLAEALRIRRAWALAGIGQSVADSYLGQLRSEVSWVRRALHSVCPPPRCWVETFAALEPPQQRQL